MGGLPVEDEVEQGWRYGEIYGDAARCGEILARYWGDMGRCHLPVKEEVEQGARAVVAHELVPEHVRAAEEQAVGDVAHVDVHLA